MGMIQKMTQGTCLPQSLSQRAADDSRPAVHLFLQQGFIGPAVCQAPLDGGAATVSWADQPIPSAGLGPSTPAHGAHGT